MTGIPHPRVRTTTVHCECGNRKSKHSETCARCDFIDGTKLTGLIIAELRRAGRLTVRELCECIFGGWSKSRERSIGRAARAMVESGRATRYVSESHGEQEISGICSGEMRERVTDAWAYALSGRHR